MADDNIDQPVPRANNPLIHDGIEFHETLRIIHDGTAKSMDEFSELMKKKKLEEEKKKKGEKPTG